MFVATSFVLLTIATGLIHAQVPFPLACPKQTVVNPFRVTRYAGLWYEYARYFAIFQADGKCATAEYSVSRRGVIGVNNTQVNILTNNPRSIIGTAEPSGDSREAKLTLTFPTTGDAEGKYWVLDTDYTSYSIVWSCTDKVLANVQYMWVLTRDRVPSAALISRVNGIIDSKNLSRVPLKKTNQSCRTNHDDDGH